MPGFIREFEEEVRDDLLDLMGGAGSNPTDTDLNNAFENWFHTSGKTETYDMFKDERLE